MRRISAIPIVISQDWRRQGLEQCARMSKRRRLARGQNRASTIIAVRLAKSAMMIIIWREKRATIIVKMRVNHSTDQEIRKRHTYEDDRMRNRWLKFKE